MGLLYIVGVLCASNERRESLVPKYVRCIRGKEGLPIEIITTYAIHSPTPAGNMPGKPQLSAPSVDQPIVKINNNLHRILQKFATLSAVFVFNCNCTTPLDIVIKDGEVTDMLHLAHA